MATKTKGVPLLLLLLASFHVRMGSAQYRSVSCTMSDGRRGICTPDSQCQYAIDLVRRYRLNRNIKPFLDANACGFIGNQHTICCPQGHSITVGGNPFPPNQGGNSGGNIQGSGGQRFPSQGGLNNPGNQGRNPAGQLTRPNTGSVLPATCGIITSNRIFGGEATDLGEYPWMAMIEYLEYGQTLRTGCGGSLISNRYVLTAAHCIRGIPPTWQVRSVRLGEHNTATNRDCVNDGSDRICADPAITVRYERIIVHEQYNNPERFRNDIALIRLRENVKFTAYIQPICLPADDSVSRGYMSAGWGQTEKGRSSEVKLKVRLDLANFRQCAQRYRNKGVVLGEGQMCAGGTAGKDTCKGDSGGPLMKFATQNGQNRWVVDGIVSLGQKPCGQDGWSGVYTKVVNYVPWIQRNIRA